VTAELVRFDVPLARLQTVNEMLPGRVMVISEGPALLLAMRGIQERKAVLVLPLPFGRFEVRARDAGWLELEAAKL
jgi:hypothetical protein